MVAIELTGNILSFTRDNNSIIRRSLGTVGYNISPLQLSFSDNGASREFLNAPFANGITFNGEEVTFENERELLAPLFRKGGVNPPTPANFGNMRLRTLTENDYTKSHGIEKQRLESGPGSFSQFFNEGNVQPSSASPVATRTLNHQGRAIPLDVNDIKNSWATWLRVEPFTTEDGFETYRIIGESITNDPISGNRTVDVHICIGFIYVNNDTTKGYALWGGGRSSLFFSWREGSSNIGFGGFGFDSSADAVNLLPLAIKGRVDLSTPLKPNERINIEASHILAFTIWGTLVELDMASRTTLASIGAIDIDMSTNTDNSFFGTLTSPVRTLVDENGVSFSMSGALATFGFSGQLDNINYDFIIKLVEIVEILE